MTKGLKFYAIREIASHLITRLMSFVPDAKDADVLRELANEINVRLAVAESARK